MSMKNVYYIGTRDRNANLVPLSTTCDPNALPAVD